MTTAPWRPTSWRNSVPLTRRVLLALLIAMAAWPAYAGAAEDPKQVACDALSAMVLGRREEALTRNNNLPGADRGHVAMLALEMGVAAARPGEVVRMPSGTRITAGASPDELVFVGMMGSIEVPFRLRKVKGEWKVVPEPYFEYLRSMGAI